MVRTLQIKFVKTAMTAISVLLLAVICAISGIYSFDTYRKEKNTAEMLADSGGIPDFVKMKRDRQEGFEPGPHDMQRPEGTDSGNPFFDNRMSPDDVMAVRYFMIHYDTDGGIESADTGSIYSVTDEEAMEYGRQVIAGGKQSGIIGHFMYCLKDNEDGKTAAFVDVSSQISSILSVIVISLVIAAIAWILMFVFVSALSRRAIAPIAENIVRQKQFVTNAGHELKTPLAIIMANTEALELFNGESKWTRNIKAQTRRLNDLMQNLLTLSKMDEADLNLPMQDFDIGELIGEAAAPFEEPAREKGLMLSVETPQITVRANRGSIGQLIGILLEQLVLAVQDIFLDLTLVGTRAGIYGMETRVVHLQGDGIRLSLPHQIIVIVAIGFADSLGVLGDFRIPSLDDRIGQPGDETGAKRILAGMFHPVDRVLELGGEDRRGVGVVVFHGDAILAKRIHRHDAEAFLPIGSRIEEIDGEGSRQREVFPFWIDDRIVVGNAVMEGGELATFLVDIAIGRLRAGEEAEPQVVRVEHLHAVERPLGRLSEPGEAPVPIRILARGLALA